MKISDLRGLLKNKQVIEEINKHLWIESKKAGHSIGIERATDEWLRMYAMGWMKYHMPEKYDKMMNRKTKKTAAAAKKKTTTMDYTEAILHEAAKALFNDCCSVCICKGKCDPNVDCIEAIKLALKKRALKKK